jgi:pimeloyl-ACP methyl ester carboxylesterase
MPLPPSEMYPAGLPDVRVRTLSLRSGIRMRVAERGPMDGTRVVMLHGWGASLYMYRQALERLPALGIRAIAVDLRGYGLSDKPLEPNAYSLKAYFADIDALIDELGGEPVALVGQSMGGGLALRYAMANPSRLSRLVLINPTGLSHVPYIPLLRFAPMFALDAIGPHLVQRWAIAWILRRLAYGDASLVTERDVDEYWAPTQLAGFVHAARAAVTEFDWSVVSDAEASGLGVDTLVVLGERDRLLRTSREQALRLRNARVEQVPGGHCANEEHPDVVYGLLAEFVNRPR